VAADRVGRQAPDGPGRTVLDTGRAHPARVYDYLLGGQDNFPADREEAREILRRRPDMRRDVRAQREFMHRAVRYLARLGVTQFLDLGTGIPTKPNLHEVAQEVAPAARVVYVDKDPVVLVHAKALLAGSPEGKTAYIAADLRNPAEILRQAAETLDFSRPVAITLVGILVLIGDEDDPYGIVAQLMNAVSPGSYLVISDPAGDIQPEALARRGRRHNQVSADRQTRRDFGEISRFFAGLEMSDPGLVQCHRWRPVPGTPVDGYDVPGWAGAGRKP
jgi:O-methyltransferase involved in polyketide biosynthesis